MRHSHTCTCTVDLLCCFQIQLSTSLSEVRDAVEAAADLLTMLGSLRPVKTMDERDAIVRSALSFYLVGRMMPAYRQ